MADRPKSDDGVPMFSLREAAAWRILKVRQPIWANAFDHLVIILHEGRITPWASLFCPFNKDLNGRDPVALSTILELDLDAQGWVPYHGPDAESDAYKGAVAAFERVKSRVTERDGMIVVEAESGHG